MYSFISIDMIISFLNKFGIDYNMLAPDTQSLVVVLFQIAAIMLIAFVYTLGRRLAYRFF